MIELSIVIVNWNTRKLLQDCLESIYKQTKNLDFEIIVVDNGSTDGSIEEILKYKDIRISRNKSNVGFAKANNQGIKIAQGRYVLLLNTDTKVKNNALKKLIDFADSRKNLGVVGPKLLNKDGSAQPSTAPFLTLFNAFVWLFTQDRFLYSSPKSARQTDWVMGSALLVSRPAIKKAGLLDEKFFMYVEEQEWCYRIKKAGFENWFYPEAQIYHLVRGSSISGRQGAILGIYENMIYFYRKHFAHGELYVLKFLLLAKAVIAWLIGVLTGNKYLKETYAKAFKMAR